MYFPVLHSIVIDHQIHLQLFDSSFVPSESKDDSSHPAPLAIVQLDLVFDLCCLGLPGRIDLPSAIYWSWSVYQGGFDPAQSVCLLFFLAHAAHARGSDGHQNVLWSVNYSQVEREQVKCKKPDVFRLQKQNKPRNTNTNQTQTKKTSRKLSETLRFQNDEILGALNTSSRRHSDSRR